MSTVTTLNDGVKSAVETMTSLQIAEITGKNHKDVMRAIRNMEPSWLKVCGRNFALTYQSVVMPNGGTRQEPCYSLTKTECLYIATKFNDEARAKLVLRWEELEMDRLNRSQNPVITQVEVQFYIADRLAQSLRLNEVSRLGMYKAIADPYGIPVPAYVQSKGVHRAAKDLLAEIGSPLNTRRFNLLLEAAGYIEKKTRTTSKGGSKSFWIITEKGLQYGENCVSPNNPNETQPHWYEDRFAHLYEIVTGSNPC